MPINPNLNKIDDCLYRLAIRALIYHEGKVLLVREKDDDWWGFPGGGVDYGEHIAEALPRELAEELGVSPEEIEITDEIAHAAIGSVVNGVPRANLFYCVKVPADKIRATDDIQEFGWFAPLDISSEVLARYAGPSTGGPAKLLQALTHHANV